MNALKGMNFREPCVMCMHRNTGSQNRRPSSRAGATLLEVLLATALFAGGLAAVSQILRGGSQAALRSQLESLAAIRCQSAMEQVLTLGVTSLDTIARDLAEDNTWKYQITSQPAKENGLQQITIRVEHRDAPELGQFELNRLVAFSRGDSR